MLSFPLALFVSVHVLSVGVVCVCVCVALGLTWWMEFGRTQVLQVSSDHVNAQLEAIALNLECWNAMVRCLYGEHAAYLRSHFIFPGSFRQQSFP